MNQKEFLIGAGWPVAAAMLLALVAYSIFAGHYEKVGRQLAEERAAADRIQDDLRNSQKTIDDLAAARESVSEYLPELYRIDEAQKLIDRIAERAAGEGAVMVDIQLDIPKLMEMRNDKDPILLVPFQASFDGDFFSLGSFLSGFEKAPFVYKLTEMGVVLSGNAENELRLTLKGAVRFFSGDLVERYLNDAA